MSLDPVISSKPGKLWRDSETLRGAQRERLDVLRELDRAGLGEGAGYKVLERKTSWYGTEHHMLALLMERGQRVPARSDVMLTELHEPLRAALLRVSLPLLSHQPIYPQLVAEQSLGYICLSRGGTVLEANRRAHHLVDRYGMMAGIRGTRGALGAFTLLARQRTGNGQPWQLRDPESRLTLLVDVHDLAKEAHVLPEDIILLQMREIGAPPLSLRAQAALNSLTTRRRQIALLLVSSGGCKKTVGNQLGLSTGTIRKQAENIFKKLHVHSIRELEILLTK